ncbi:MAG: hypothetical protein ACRD0U_08960 [Acidimicrobiales bacterium]
MVARLTVALAVIAVLLGVGADPALAHTITGVEPTNYRSELVTMTPRTPDLEIELLDLGRRIRLTNDTGTEITVLGYQGEDYLRVGPDGAYENINSPTLYANRTPAEPLPADTDVNSDPEWRRIGAGPAVTWRDRRTRWEGPDPPAVVAAPGQRHVVSTWHIRLAREDTTTIDLVGRITWIPGPSATPWIVLTAVVAAAVAAIGWSRRWAALLVAVLAGLTAVDVVNVSAGTARTVNSPLLVVASTVLRDPLTTIAWVAAAGGLVLLHRREQAGVLFTGLAGWIIAAASGFTDTGVFARSQIPTRLAPELIRSYVALTIGLGVGITVASLTVGIRKGWLPWRRLLPAR